MLTKTELKESRYFVVFLACMVAITPLSIDAYLPAIPDIADYFNTSIAAVNLTMSTFMVGNAIGQFFGGALSDQLGRKTIGQIGIGLYFISTMLIMLASSIEAVQFLRASQAIGSGFASVICLAQIKDLYPREEVMRRFANVVLIMFLAPIVAPILGVLLLPLGWHAIFVFIGSWSLLVLLVYTIWIPETIGKKALKFSYESFFKGYWRVLKHRVDGRLVASRYILFGALNAGVFMTFLINSALIYMHYFSLSEHVFALVFAAHGLMLMVGNRVAVKLTDSYRGLKVLGVLNLIQLLLLLILFLFVFFEMHNLAVVLVLMLLIISIGGAINPTSAATYIVYFDENTGAATSLKTTAIFLAGGIIGGIAALLAKGDIMPIVAIMTVCVIAARVVLLSIRET